MIERVSLQSYANEPLNWKRAGTVIPCNPQNGASDCPWIDDCTVPYCSFNGECSYEALACNSPSFSKCYPDTICGGPVQERASKTSDYPYGKTIRGCDLPSDNAFSMFGHGAEDVDVFGWYNVRGQSIFYWKTQCRNVPLDCYVSAWGPWEACNQGRQRRSRSVRVTPISGGKGCPPLQETRNCVAVVANAVQGTDSTFATNTQGSTFLGLPEGTGLALLVSLVVLSVLVLVVVVAVVIMKKNKIVEHP